MNAVVRETEDFRREVAAWLKANKPADPGFLLPQSFMEVGSEEQLDFLREWQHRVWSAGYLGMAWPREYGGQGVDASTRTSSTRRCGARRCLSVSTSSASAGPDR
jgi:alkylation response protein AidB-like acyl-CoA dehydrogenase